MGLNTKRSWSRSATLNLLACLSLAASAGAHAVDSTTATTVPKFDHIVVVVEENTSESSIIGNTTEAPYINSLASAGASFTQSSAVTHPSQPNYIALFSGDTQGVTDDSCLSGFSGVENLGHQLIAAGSTFTGYSQSMPSNGYTGCSSGNYAQKHNPWVEFDNVPSASNLTFGSFPSDFTKLPTLSFVIPNLCNDMHNCSIATGDTWLKNNIDRYAQWAKTHNSLLIVTWDEDDSSTSANLIPTLFYGANVKTGSYAEAINHYDVLATLETMYGLSILGPGAAISDVWSTVNAPDYTVGVSPSSLSVTQGGSGTATSTMTSLNGFNAAVSLSVSGLPSGVVASFSPATVTPAANGSAASTLTLTASSTAMVGAATVTVAGTSGASSHNAMFNLTVNPGGGGSTQSLGNPGFENGATATPWSASSGVICSNTSCSGQTAHSGEWYAWLDGYGQAHTDTVSQQVAIPSGDTSAVLTYWMHIDTAETGATAHDTLTVQVLNTTGRVLGTLATFSNVDAASGYVQHTADLSAYIGQTVVLRFTGTEDSSNQTSFVLDDVTLTVH